MKSLLKKLSILTIVFSLGACELDGDLDNPNQVPVAGADVDYLMNLVQLNFADYFSSVQGNLAPLVRYNAMTGGYRYQLAYQPQFQDGIWSNAYQGILVQAETLIPLAQAKNLTTHVAVAKILSAYVYLSLVDQFNDVPQVEALKGGELNFNPNATAATDVYAYAISLLGEARTELAKTGTDAGAALGRDIYYGGSRTNWTALCNTLELKAWINIAQIPGRKSEADAKIATFINPTTGASVLNIIDTPAENFTYRYGAVDVPAGSRHPQYDQYYGPSAGGAGGYLGNHFMYEMFNASDYTDDGVGTGNAIQDPRWRYYFYRQVGSIDPSTNGFDVKALGCTPGVPPPHYVSGGVKVFCVFEPGFYGRDHGDASGTPPDGPVMTTAGIYPAGGRPDNTSTANVTYQGSTQRGQGANGAGIQPIWMSFHTDFIKAEVVARAGNTAASKTLLETAILNSISSIKSFADGKGQSVTIAPWTSATTSTAWANFTTNYKNAALLAFDNATTKMDIIALEAWKAFYGNGYEAYNLYRRTGAPKALQPTIQINPGPWIRTLIYPAVYVNLNLNATQRDINVVNKVFWDNNPSTLN
ncbi:MAG: SusD/RagB family nutrient-binding outer membrane lipoprotein [Cyclobacteriaceae bacterium]|nr:SusD/RagB family nutrient-binding outer membrane lipoprotein [Cyclobacteriaceae bacterium]